jgi:hypothetical protein
MERIDELILKYQRIGARDRARWLETIDQKVPPSFKERIKDNDKKILRELILPEWVTWDLLRSWALEGSEGEICGFCDKSVDKFVLFKDVVICENCLKELKNLQPPVVGNNQEDNHEL